MKASFVTGLGIVLVLIFAGTACGLNYMYFSDCELTRFGDHIKWWHGDTLSGPIRTNGCFAVMQDPNFYDWVIMGCDSLGAPTPGCDTLGSPPGPGWNPIVDRGFLFGAPELLLPQEATWVRQQAASTGDFYTGGDSLWARVLLGDHTFRLWWAPLDSAFNEDDYTDHELPDQAVIFFDCPQVNLSGVLTTELILGTRGRVGLEDNVLYASANPANGVAPAGHPEKLAVVAEGEIKVLNTVANGRENSSGEGNNQLNPALTDIVLDGIYVALNETFTFAQQNDPDSGYVCPCQPDDRGTIYLYGSLIQGRRGYVHRSTRMSTGYLKQYRYDQDLKFWDLHLYPNARENIFDVPAVAFGEVPVGQVRWDTVRIANDYIPIPLDTVRASQNFLANPLVLDTALWEQPVAIGYAPTAPGEHTGTLEIVINEYGQTYTLPLSGSTPGATGVDAPAATPPADYVLTAAPNPFNATTVIRFTLPQAGDVSLELYDLLGRHCLTLATGTLTAGTHAIPVNGSPLASGLYLARLRTANQTSLLKLALIK